MDESLRSMLKRRFPVFYGLAGLDQFSDDELDHWYNVDLPENIEVLARLGVTVEEAGRRLAEVMLALSEGAPKPNRPKATKLAKNEAL